MNEALILRVISLASAAGDDPRGVTVSRIAELLLARTHPRTIDPGSIYIALRRMAERGYVSLTKVRTAARDGRIRDVAFYKMEPEGEAALQHSISHARALIDEDLRPSLPFAPPNVRPASAH